MKVGSIIREKDNGDYGNIDSINGEGDETLIGVKLFSGGLPEQLTKKDFDEQFDVICD